MDSDVKLVIVCDMDDTLCEFNDKWLRDYRRRSGHNLLTEQISSWNIDSYVLPEWRAPEGKPYYEGKFFQILFEPHYFDDIEPIEGAVETVRALYNAGHEIIIATSAVANHPNIIAGKLFWLKTYMPWLPERNVIFIQRKELLKADVIIDDNADHVSNIQGNGGKGILVDRPWNQTPRITPDLRIKTWRPVKRAIQKWEKAA